MEFLHGMPLSVLPSPQHTLSPHATPPLSIPKPPQALPLPPSPPSQHCPRPFPELALKPPLALTLFVSPSRPRLCTPDIGTEYCALSRAPVQQGTDHWVVRMQTLHDSLCSGEVAQMVADLRSQDPSEDKKIKRAMQFALDRGFPGPEGMRTGGGSGGFYCNFRC